MAHKGANSLRLWLDDSRQAPEGWTWCHNVEEAKVKLLSCDVDDLSLDFDMDAPHCSTCQYMCGYVDDEGCDKNCTCHETNGRENGMGLLTWMAEWGIWSNHKPVVHSANPREAQKMKLFIEENYPHAN